MRRGSNEMDAFFFCHLKNVSNAGTVSMDMQKWVATHESK
jgi:hypothetical protein